MKSILSNFKNLSVDEKLAALEKLAQEFGRQSMPYLKVISEKDPSAKTREHARKLYESLADIRPDALDIEPDETPDKTAHSSTKKNRPKKSEKPKSKTEKKSKKENSAENRKEKGAAAQSFKVPQGLIRILKSLVKPAAALLILYFIWAPCVSFYQSSKEFIITKSAGLKKSIMTRISKSEKSSDLQQDSETNDTEYSDDSADIPKQDPQVVREIKESVLKAGKDLLAGRTGLAVEAMETLCSENSFLVYPQLADACFILYDCYTLSGSDNALEKRSDLINRMLEELPETKELSNKLLLKALDCTNNSQDYYSAIVLLEKAVACDPENTGAIKCLAQLYRAGDNNEKAEELLSMIRE